MKKLFYVRKQSGCGLIASESLKEATKEFIKDWGSYELLQIREADEKDIAWVRGMGGRVPDVK